MYTLARFLPCLGMRSRFLRSFFSRRSCFVSTLSSFTGLTYPVIFLFPWLFLHSVPNHFRRPGTVLPASASHLANSLSILSGSHIPICRAIRTLLENSAREDILWIVGGNIPRKDHQDLKDIGVDAVFGVGSSPQSIVDYIRERVHESRA